MKKLTSVAGAGVIALSLGLVGCGSDSSEEAVSSSATSSAEEGTSSSEAVESFPPAGPNETIQDYIVKYKIQEAEVKPTDPGAPVINLPVPPGWQGRVDLPEAPFGAIFYPTSAVPSNPPRVLAIVSKLTGDINTDELLQYAPGEVKRLPGWQGSEGARFQLTGFEGFQIAGTYDKDGRRALIGQKSIVIPADDGAYLLQLNAYSDESEAATLDQATQAIDRQMSITPA